MRSQSNPGEFNILTLPIKQLCLLQYIMLGVFTYYEWYPIILIMNGNSARLSDRFHLEFVHLHVMFTYLTSNY